MQMNVKLMADRLPDSEVIKVSNAVQYLPAEIVWDLAVRGFVIDDNCVIYMLSDECHLRLYPVGKSVPQTYEELVARHGTGFKIYFIIYQGNICTLSMFRMSPYVDTVAHGVINELARWVE
jgi:hypothetical protein